MTLRQLTHEEQAAEDALFWRSQPVGLKMQAIAEMAEWYAQINGIDLNAEGPKRVARVIQRTRS